MAYEQRVRMNFAGGMVEDNPLASTATTLTSASLAVVPAISAPVQYLPITLDPDGFDGPPEIAWITAHGANANTATLLRGQEGTAARLCYQDTPWVHGPTTADVTTDSDRWVTESQFALTGGGVRKYDGANISWSTRFIAISTGTGGHASTAGYVDINMPPVGTVIPGYFGVGGQTVVAAGLPFPAWNALWYELTPGQTNTSDPTKFRLTYYNGTSTLIPRNWVLIAIQNGDDNYIKWGTGEVSDQWRTPTLLNGWVQYATPYGPTQYRKERGVVYIEGLVSTGSATQGNVIFNLPVGYRPSRELLFLTTGGGDVLGEFRIGTNGDIKWWVGSNAFFSMTCNFLAGA